jgi:hypothetical protein
MLAVAKSEHVPNLTEAKRARVHDLACPTCEELRASLAVLQSRVAALEQRGAPRDAADVDLVMAVAAAAGAEWFTANHLLAHARVDARLAAVLLSADISSASEVGCWLRMMATIGTVEGLTVVKGRRSGQGRTWRVVTVC